MAIINRPTWIQKFTDFINRVAPFDAEPLIQKTEHLEVEVDLGDSVVFREPTTASISEPGANFTVDFATADEVSVNTSSSIPASFNVTLANLRNNQVGRIIVTKKSGDVFSFANGEILNHDGSNTGQSGKTSLQFYVMKTGSAYKIIPGYLYQITNSMIANDAITTAKVVNASITEAKTANSSSSLITGVDSAFFAGGTIANRKTVDGVIQYNGTVNIFSGPSYPTTISTLPVGSRPVVNVKFLLPRSDNTLNYCLIEILTNGNIIANPQATGNYDLSSVIYPTK
jgi:hypothetical protein